MSRVTRDNTLPLTESEVKSNLEGRKGTMNGTMNGADRALLTVHELAQLLNVKASWVYGKVAAGDIPHLHVGRYPRFDRDEVLAWVRSDRSE